MKKYVIALLTGTTLSLGSCSEFLTEAPESFLSPSNFPASAADVEIALGGLQNYMRGQAYYDRAFYFLAEVSSDHTFAAYTSGLRYEIDAYTYQVDHQYVREVWGEAYQTINEANMLIQRIPAIASLTDAERGRYLGAAQFMRALNYFHLVRLYGDLPLLTEPVNDFEAGATLERSPVAEIYQVIVSDLQAAEQTLPTSWGGGEGWPTQGAAKTLLAKVYMTMAGAPLNETSYWAQAAAKAKEVMASNQYQLLEDVADLWKIEHKNSAEHIFSIQNHADPNNAYSIMSVQSRPGSVGDESGWSFWHTSLDFMNEFDDQDERKAASFLTEVVTPDQTYPYTVFGNPDNPLTNHPYIKKWYDAGRSNFQDRSRRTDTNIPVFRYAEVLLMFAEAENEANGPTADAFAALNQVRTRAGLAELSGLGQEELRQAIRQERSFELCFESKRRFDLVRWNTLDQAMAQDSIANVGYAPYKTIYPVPQLDLSLNENLGQNTGYGN
ncbi:Starch-binding associating with outer membrane [Catalinimonas alkaloidigena]|uniref:Starch-binding associating with outer membrane n=1 Tax=Catalinimonas alkaloidigena TaxID=1075417 RepID=A0A1G9HHZ4_9BACT|nr:RagB/SusD family nutrient uptake outer membrane protein [Catalinimonas alkaloidigena]SDL12386.1 Starch-binding associating with outer membrane [Catalinimonas alkaloidigena]